MTLHALVKGDCIVVLLGLSILLTLFLFFELFVILGTKLSNKKDIFEFLNQWIPKSCAELPWCDLGSLGVE